MSRRTQYQTATYTRKLVFVFCIAGIDAQLYNNAMLVIIFKCGKVEERFNDPPKYIKTQNHLQTLIQS